MMFWVIAIALLALALFMLLLPLLRKAAVADGAQRQQQNIQIAREKKQQLQAQLDAAEIDQAEFDGAYLDLQTALALELQVDETAVEKSRGRWMAIVVLLAIPLSSIALYLALGEYRVIENPTLALAPAPQTNPAPQMSLEEMEAAVRQRLRDDPEDAEGWFMLGRLKMGNQLYAEAVTAFQRSNDLVADEPGILFALADALAMQNNGSLMGEPEQLIARGLKLAPMFPNGLWLAGMAAEQRQDYQTAHQYWTQLLPLIQDNPASAREIRALLMHLEEREPQLAAATPLDDANPIRVSVDISAELRARASPQTAVFVYAKAMQGPPMPLAVKKLQLADLPVELSLSDADAMMPDLKLSGFAQVIVGARVSFSGNPVAQSGDFYTETDAVDSASPPSQVALIIDRVK